MKKFNLLAVVAIVSLGIAFTSCDSKKSMGSVKLTSEVDSISFIFGKAQALGMKQQMEAQMGQWPIKGNMEAFLAGVYEGMDNSSDSLLLGKDMQVAGEYVNGFFQRAQQIVADEEKAAGDKFLAENKTKSGVITTESGLQYKVITEGTGPKPTIADQVKVHYVGKLLDGTQFDSTLDRGEPATFPLGGGVIQGWAEGVQLMPVGSKYMMWIPGELAYGMNPTSPQIKPNSTLVFEVELLEIVK